MRYLLCVAAALSIAACERRERTPEMSSDTTADTTRPVMADRADTLRGQTMSAVPDRLLGSWTARGYDAGSSRAQPFTMNWTRSPDGSLAGTISFQGGEHYNVKVVSTSDSTIVYESDPHRSPSLKAQVVTRTEARLRGDTLSGTYVARAQTGGKTLRGRFTATRGSASAR
jgi:hypothetical protein